MMPETLPDNAVLTVPDLPHGIGGQGSAIRQVAGVNRAAQKSGKVPGPLLSAEPEQVLQFPRDMRTAYAVAGNMRHHEAGLPAVMDTNAQGLRHDIATTLADPEVFQQTCARNMQPVETALDPKTCFIHVNDPGTIRRLPDMPIKLAETAGHPGRHVDNRPFRRFHAERAGQGSGHAGPLQ